MLILGLGNLLLADEGVGVHAVHALMAKGAREGVTLLDIGTSVLEALPELETAERVIVIDAVKAQGPAGSVYRIPYDDCITNPAIASMHGFDLSRTLALAQRERRPEVIVIGIEPGRIEWSMELSPEVSEAMPFVLAAVEEEMRSHRKKGKSPDDRSRIPEC
jgi:hydrogenase maturation protease